MPNKKYNDAMMEEVIHTINQKLDIMQATQDKKLDAIIIQTTRTNGYVAELRGWRSSATGFFTALSMFVVPVLMYLIYLHIG